MMTNKINVLVLCDDQWHPAEVIKRGMADWKCEDIFFDYMQNPEMMLTPDMLERYPVVMICKGNSINASNSTPWFQEKVTETGPNELEQYVKSGGALLVVHGGTSFSVNDISRKEMRFVKPCEQYIKLIGNSFQGHPPRNMIQIHVMQQEHPIMKNVQNFIVRDEQYQIHILDNDIEQLFETQSIESGEKAIGGYVKNLEKGRICVITLGHTLQVWRNEEFKKIITNAIRWSYEVQGEADG